MNKCAPWHYWFGLYLSHQPHLQEFLLFLHLTGVYEADVWGTPTWQRSLSESWSWPSHPPPLGASWPPAGRSAPDGSYRHWRPSGSQLLTHTDTHTHRLDYQWDNINVEQQRLFAGLHVSVWGQEKRRGRFSLCYSTDCALSRWGMNVGGWGVVPRLCDGMQSTITDEKSCLLTHF